MPWLEAAFDVGSPAVAGHPAASSQGDAGWAGCTVNLVRATEQRLHDFAEAVRTSYSRKTGTLPEIHICRAADGAFGLDLVPSGS